MQAWIELDKRGRQVLVRSGTGRVTAVVPLAAPAAEADLVRIEIECDPPAGRSARIRYSAHPVVVATDPLLARSQQACQTGESVQWTVRWQRHDPIPDALPITSLNLATDAQAVLIALAPATATALEHAARQLGSRP